MEEWIKNIVQKIRPNFFTFANLKFWPNSINSIVDIPYKGKPTMYLGLFGKNKMIMTGEVAHEIAEIKLDSEKLHEKIYYKFTLRLTKSYRLAQKYSWLLALASLLIYRNETKADQLGLRLLKSAKLDPACMEEYLIWLNSQRQNNILLKITNKKRLQNIQSLLK